MYNKDEVLTFGDSLYTFLKGLRDGIDQSDMMNLVNTMMNAPAIMNEAKEDWDAFGSHLGSKLLDKFGDDRINPTGDVPQ